MHHPDHSRPESPLPAAVYIVGAGPGDPELLTVKAQRLLAQADVVLFADSLVPSQVLQGVRPEAELIRTAHKTLEEILPLMIERVQAGRSVVRLHSGDPSLYGAVQEQMQALVEANIPFEVVPGISAFQAAAARLRVELTVPELVQSIILSRISGRTEVPDTEELETLAAHQASLCLYLSARHVEQVQTKLLRHYPPTTPVAICFRLGWQDEKIWLVKLEQMAAVTRQENLIRTTLYVISPVLAAATVPEEFAHLDSGNDLHQRRSQLYNPNHSHLFRPSGRRSDEG
ncbi:precorrin-4 C(11)-methyltransferase [Leptothermofonsia sichuanensis E412]|uniref:precorrin-4 C(11)-methyltransferase n=1 Tax=Leptothermofonsia sichuanensis TaxID=2917832 RepID=UPI001CA644E7|nr:precorrin-4 C(11)-methyltransferase [Leptothermofonsia sichuanensis]QZZ22496.1 precorrin-4 C(11)-methyltransferase [Leptothermofonsia sichuanensis E412]